MATVLRERMDGGEEEVEIIIGLTLMQPGAMV